ncbi:hypothetical protein JXB27_04185 [Candidatus Woesearchaeota archaeon]|nr:hypothetical protein [Candidatus Woesearchaeota archaeon]
MEEREESSHECPLCASRNVSYSIREKAWVCRDCGSVSGGIPIMVEKPREEVVKEILPSSLVRKKEALVARAAKKAKLAKKKAKLAKRKGKKKVRKAKKKISKRKPKKKTAKKIKKSVKKSFLRRLLRRR